MIVANCFFAESSGLRLDSVVMGSTLGIFKNMCYLKFIRETNLIIISIKTQLLFKFTSTLGPLWIVLFLIPKNLYNPQLSEWSR